MIRIAIFASGTGTNALELIRFFKNSKTAKVELVVSNNSNAGVCAIAKEQGVNLFLINNEELQTEQFVLNELVKQKIDFIVLAGFLRKVPTEIIRHYTGKIINIHPALLPKFGGKGMYGDNVHQAVIDSGETESGISIHFVTEHYDEGAIIFQAKCSVDKNETAKSLANKVHALEHEYFSKITQEQIELCFHSI